jgi:hypothetical protein
VDRYSAVTEFISEFLLAGELDELWPPAGALASQALLSERGNELWFVGGAEWEQRLREFCGISHTLSFAPNGDPGIGDRPAWRIVRLTPPGVAKRARTVGNVKGKPARTVGKVKGKPARNAQARAVRTRRGATRGPNAAFMSPVTPSPQLSAIVGAEPLPRVELTKRLWRYIKRHGLQDRENRRMINTDAKLRAIFKTDQISMFDMTKAIARHVR